MVEAKSSLHRSCYPIFESVFAKSDRLSKQEEVKMKTIVTK